METVIACIVTLAGLFFTIGKPILSMCTRVEKMQMQTDRNAQEIDRNINDIKGLLQISQSHEVRIHDLEQDMDIIKGKDK